ncbi:MAG: lysophospholipid acyltransferase family protein [bacterium]|nr:lysophospholipid acyltransferase family protein [bacterium]
MTEKAQRSRPFKQFLMRRVYPPLAIGLLRLLGFSWRYVGVRRHLLDEALASGRPLVAAFFHGRTFQLLHYMSLPGHGRWVLMCSKSLDGDLMSRVERGLGFQVVRGSSGSGGAKALVEMIRMVKKDPGLASCLAVDGSRGPRGIAQAGILSLAQKTGAVLMPVASSARPGYVLKHTWDRTTLPMPWARVHILFGDPIEVPRKLSPEQTGEILLDLENRLLELHREADERSGFRDTEPMQAPLPAGGSA